MAALKWLARGYFYEVTGAEIWSIYFNIMKAAENAGRKEQIPRRILVLMEEEGASLVSDVLGRTLRQSTRG